MDNHMTFERLDRSTFAVLDAAGRDCGALRKDRKGWLWDVTRTDARPLTQVQVFFVFSQLSRLNIATR